MSGIRLKYFKIVCSFQNSTYDAREHYVSTIFRFSSVDVAHVTCPCPRKESSSSNFYLIIVGMLDKCFRGCASEVNLYEVSICSFCFLVIKKTWFFPIRADITLLATMKTDDSDTYNMIRKHGLNARGGIFNFLFWILTSLYLYYPQSNLKKKVF